MIEYQSNVSIKLMTTLRAGGNAERYCEVFSADQLAEAVIQAHTNDWHITVLGGGSNMLVSDKGLPGLVIRNQAKRILVAKTGEVLVESGAKLQDLFLKTAQSSLKGLEFAVGIPGSVGGALVSNAGAYRSNVSEFITRRRTIREYGGDYARSVALVGGRSSRVGLTNPRIHSIVGKGVCAGIWISDAGHPALIVVA